jgi:hypothetical protein
MSWIKRGLDKLGKDLDFGGGHFSATTVILPCYLMLYLEFLLQFFI